MYFTIRVKKYEQQHTAVQYVFLIIPCFSLFLSLPYYQFQHQHSIFYTAHQSKSFDKYLHILTPRYSAILHSTLLNYITFYHSLTDNLFA
nr:MAG TPA: hypothetical protein [Caudoviricetes sp.]